MNKTISFSFNLNSKNEETQEILFHHILILWMNYNETANKNGEWKLQW